MPDEKLNYRFYDIRKTYKYIFSYDILADRAMARANIKKEGLPSNRTSYNAFKIIYG